MYLASYSTTTVCEAGGEMIKGVVPHVTTFPLGFAFPANPDLRLIKDVR